MKSFACVSVFCLASVLSLFAAGPVEVAVDPACPVGAVYACAASDGGRVAILVANPTRESLPCRLSVPGFVLKSRRLTDDTRTDQTMAGVPQELPPYSFVVILGERS